MNKKRMLCLALAACTVLSFTGCKKDNTANTSKKEEDSKIIWIGTGPTVRDMDRVNEEINKYTKEKIGQEVDMYIVSSGYNDKLQMMIASNERVDLCFSANYQKFAENASKNFYMDMTDVFNEYGRDVKALYPDYVYESGIIDGKMYALPAWKDFSYEYTVNYRTKVASELGLDMEKIESIADLEPYFEAFKAKYPNDFPCCINKSYNFFCTLGYVPIGDLSSVGAIKVDGTDGKIVNPYETDEAMEMFKLMRKWFLKGYIKTDAATNGEVSGNYLVTLGQPLPYQTEVANLSRPEDQQAADLHLWEPWLVSTAGSMQSIPRTAQNPTGAMKFLNLINTDKYLRNLVAHGMEGVDYIKTDENHFKYPDGKKRDDMGYYSWPFTQGNVYLTMQIDGTPDDIYEKYQEFDNNAVKAQNFGFTFNGDPIKTETAAVGNVYSKYVPAIVTGSVDPEEYLPKLLGELKTAGIDTVIKEMQKQFDAWKSSK